MGIAVIRKGGAMGDLTLEVDLYDEIRKKQLEDDRLMGWRKKVEEGSESRFRIHDDGSLRFDNRWCVPDDEELKRRILEEAHSTPYSVHPGGDKMYKDLKKTFWWPRMKKKVAEFVAKCLVCQKVKTEHMRPQGKLQPLEVPEWK
ncbi:hypothetical protein vseg_011535 [Gypsophila vaccaria]